MVTGNDKRCGGCGRPIEKAKAVHEGIRFCDTCYKREFLPVACATCGKTIRSYHGLTPAACKPCRSSGRTCIRCRRPFRYAGRITPDGSLCPSCNNALAPTKTCSYCGCQSKYVSRDRKRGLTEPACQFCKRSFNINCPVCGKNRLPAGKNHAGQTVCQYCLDHDGIPFICPQCGSEGKFHSTERCAACYSRDFIGRTIERMLPTYRHDWARELCAGFFAEYTERLGHPQSRFKFQRYFTFFAELDARFEELADITDRAVLEGFGSDWLHKWIIPAGYLMKRGILSGELERAYRRTIVNERHDKMFAPFEGTWKGRLLRDYQKHLWETHDRYRERGWTDELSRFVWRTVLSHGRAATSFLASLGPEVTASTQIEQIHLDRFLWERPGYRTGLGTFVRYLVHRRKVFVRLEINYPPVEFSKDSYLGYERYLELIGTWLKAPDDELKGALICLLILLYGQSTDRVVAIRMENVRRGDDGRYRIAFATVDVSLDPEVGALLERHLAQRRALAVMEDDHESPWLFPGRKYGQHLDTLSLQKHFDKYGVKAKQLFASAMFYALVFGDMHPKTLVQGFGVTDYTAMRYYKLINARTIEEMKLRFGIG